MKKVSVVLLAGLLASSTALAGDPLPMVSDLNIKLGAYAAFESGFSNQGKLKGTEKNISANKRGFAFYNDTALFAAISNTRVNSVKLAVSHILAPGLKPYAEIHAYTLKGKPEFYPNLKARKVKGTVALVGVKLSL